MTDTTSAVVAPRLIVSDGDQALDFYAKAFGVEPTDRMYVDGQLVNAHVRLGDTDIGVTQEDGGLNRSPSALSGSPVAISVTVTDVDAAAQRFLDAGGTTAIEVDDRPYGRRDGRLIDPSGHIWILGQELG